MARPPLRFGTARPAFRLEVEFVEDASGEGWMTSNECAELLFVKLGAACVQDRFPLGVSWRGAALDDQELQEIFEAGPESSVAEG